MSMLFLFLIKWNYIKIIFTTKPPYKQQPLPKICLFKYPDNKVLKMLTIHFEPVKIGRFYLIG